MSRWPRTEITFSATGPGVSSDDALGHRDDRRVTDGHRHRHEVAGGEAGEARDETGRRPGPAERPHGVDCGSGMIWSCPTAPSPSAPASAPTSTASSTASPCTWPASPGPTSPRASRATPTPTSPPTRPATRCCRPPGSATSARTSVRRTRRGPARPGSSLLAETARRVRDAGFEIGNVAVQVIGNRPRLGPRKARGRAGPVGGRRRTGHGVRHHHRRPGPDRPGRGRRRRSRPPSSPNADRAIRGTLTAVSGQLEAL